MKNFNNIMKVKMTISRKLQIGFGTIIALVLIALISIFFTLNRSSKIANNNLKHVSPSTEGMNKLNEMISETKMLIKNWVFIEKHSNTPDKVRLKTIHEEEFPKLKEGLVDLSGHWTDEEKKLFESIIKSIEDTLFRYQKHVMSSLSTFESYEDPMVVFEVYPMLEEEGVIISSTNRIFNESIKLSKLILQKEYNGNNSLVKSFNVSRIFIVIVLFIVTFIGFFSARITRRSITSPINRLQSALIRKSKGDFTRDNIFAGEDEVGEMTVALETMSESIRKIVEEIQSGAEILTVSSKSINQSSRLIADGASLQASSSEEISASMEEMTSSISQNAENAQQAEGKAKQVSHDVAEIVKSVSDTSKAMKNITEKISVINDIAERIDLLAINAAIEAARAGEHGKGFAVVASEVRNLAESSQVAANEIDNVSKISVEIAETSNQLLQGIIPHINETLKRVQEISAASAEQNAGINQVNNAIQSLTGIIQQNVSSAEELSSSSDELLHQSDRLLQGTSFFKIQENNSAEESTEEIEKQIELLKEMLLKRKGNKNTQENKKKSKNVMNDVVFPTPAKKVIDLFKDEKNDSEFENY